MRLQIKKNIAKEFLILISCLSMGILAFLFTYTYNIYQNNQASNIEKLFNEKANQADSIAKLLSEISHDNISDVFQMYPNGYFKNELEFRNFIQNANNLEECYELLPFGYFRDEKEFMDFVGNLKEKVEKQKIAKRQLKELNTEVNALKLEMNKIKNRTLSYSQQINIGIDTLLILLFLLFGFRYIAYSIQWSWKILMQK